MSGMWHVAKACAEDEALRQQVLELLRAHRKRRQFLRRDLFPPSPPTIDQPATEKLGTYIDRYKLVHENRPRRDGAWSTWPSRRSRSKRKVAPEGHQAGHGYPGGCHPLRGGSGRPLALMDHQCIATVLDGGSTPSGAALLRHGTGGRHADHRVLRRVPLHDPPATEAFRPGLPRPVQHAPPEGRHPPRHQAVETSWFTHYDRLRLLPKVIDFGIAQGRPSASDGCLGLHAWSRRWSARRSTCRRKQAERTGLGCGHAHRRLFAGRAAVRSC